MRTDKNSPLLRHFPKRMKKPGLFPFGPAGVLVFYGLFFFGGEPLQGEEVSARAAVESPRHPNILFIAVDDLRACAGFLGDKSVLTPAMDKLAEDSVVFTRHYVDQAICIPSRAAMLTGVRSQRTKQTFAPPVWENVPDISSMGSYFSDHGYATFSVGKIWHVLGPKNTDRFDYSFHPNPTGTNLYAAPELKEKPWAELSKMSAPPYERLPVEDEDYPDGRVAANAIKCLENASRNKKPFLMMVGFFKPHLPFNAPEKYWALYDKADIPMPPQPCFPENAPTFSHNGFNDMALYANPPDYKTGLPPEELRKRIQAYLACTSFVDAQIGKLIAELRRLGLYDDTIIVLWGDNGYHLGEQGLFSKATNFEMAARTPLLIRAPGVSSAGRKSEGIVESVDLFPTMVDLAGLPPLKLTDGRSLRPLLVDPAEGGFDAAFHLFPRFEDGSRPGNVRLPGGVVLGYAIRTSRYRYIEWIRGWNINSPNREVLARELYDYDADPGESRNLADEPEYESVRLELAGKLHAGPGKGW